MTGFSLNTSSQSPTESYDIASIATTKNEVSAKITI